MINTDCSREISEVCEVVAESVSPPSPPSSSSSSCPICQKAAKKECSGCHSVFYCSSEHQKEDWKFHKSKCRPYIVKRNEIYGRYLVAARDLTQGTIILTEGPLIVGPKRSTYPICLGCHKRVDGSYRCSKCGFPLCNLKCEQSSIHSDNECEVFVKGHPIGSKIVDFNSIHPAYEAVIVLRCLLLRDKDPTKWEKLITMEHHNDIRRKLIPQMWNQNEVNTVKFLREFLHLKDRFDSEIIHSCMGYIDVNCFEIKTSQIEICGMYPEAALMLHDCSPNTHHATTINGPSFQVLVRTSIPIKKGEIITTSYVDVLKGTLERRDFLKETKYFDCLCKRCSDPTEFNSLFSALKCPQCPNYILPTHPLDYNSNWKCRSLENSSSDGGESNQEGCGKMLSTEKVRSILLKVKKEIETVEQSNCGSRISRLERVVKKFSGKVLHPNHYLLIGIIRTLTKLYLQGSCFHIMDRDENAAGSGTTAGTTAGQLVLEGNFEKEILLRKRQLCLQFLHILDLIHKGISRFKGMTLYQLYKCEFPLFNVEYESAEMSKEDYNLKLHEMLEYLERAKETVELDRLLVDNPSLPIAVDVAIENICTAISNLK